MQIEILPFLDSKVTAAEFLEVSVKVWPVAWFKGRITEKFWDSMIEKNVDLRFVCIVDNRLAATFILARVERTSAPFVNLPDQGWEWVLETSVSDASSDSKIVSAISMNILPEYRGNHLSSKILFFGKNYLKAKGMKYLIAPVRPSLKSKYPLIPMGEYITWKLPSGSGIFDSWLRVHIQAGASIINICHRSMVITGGSREWLEWTGVEAIGPGNYLIPEGLVPVTP